MAEQHHEAMRVQAEQFQAAAKEAIAAITEAAHAPPPSPGEGPMLGIAHAPALPPPDDGPPSRLGSGLGLGFGLGLGLGLGLDPNPNPNPNPNCRPLKLTMPIKRGKRPPLCASAARASASRRACLPPSVPPICTLSATDCGRSSVGVRAELSWQRHTMQCAPRPRWPFSLYRPPLSRNEEASSAREPVALLEVPPPAACLASHGDEPLARLAQALQPPFVHRILSSGLREGESIS